MQAVDCIHAIFTHLSNLVNKDRAKGRFQQVYATHHCDFLVVCSTTEPNRERGSRLQRLEDEMIGETAQGDGLTSQTARGMTARVIWIAALPGSAGPF